MKRLVLQMQMSVDGFMAADDTSLDWTLWDWGPDCPWDEALLRRFNDTMAGIDTVLLSGPMAAGGYIDHWTRMAALRAGDPAYAFAPRIVSAHKRVLSQSLREVHHPRTSLGRGALATEVGALKRTAGSDVICFGGVGFAAALLEAGVVDELQLYVNPSVLGAGRSVFRHARHLHLIDATAHDCGIVVQRYRP